MKSECTSLGDSKTNTMKRDLRQRRSVCLVEGEQRDAKRGLRVLRDRDGDAEEPPAHRRPRGISAAAPGSVDLNMTERKDGMAERQRR